MIVTVRLEKRQAKDLDRVCDMIGLSHLKISERAKISQGTVWNCLNCRAIRADFAERIYNVVAKAAEQCAENRRIRSDDVGFSRRTLTSVRLQIEGGVERRTRRNDTFTPSSLTSSHLTELIMALTDVPRLVFAKSFDYLNQEHFRAHARCVAYGVNYRWLVYEPLTRKASSLKGLWNDAYIDALVDLVHGIVNKKRSIDERPLAKPEIRELVSQRVKCRVYPNVVQQPGRLVPFRFTIFENEVCMCSEEPEPRTYPYGQTIVLSPPWFSDIQRILNQLYEICPSIEMLGTDSFEAKTWKNREELLRLHKTLRTEFLRSVLRINAAANERDRGLVSPPIT